MRGSCRPLVLSKLRGLPSRCHGPCAPAQAARKPSPQASPCASTRAQTPPQWRAQMVLSVNRQDHLVTSCNNSHGAPHAASVATGGGGVIEQISLIVYISPKLEPAGDACTNVGRMPSTSRHRACLSSAHARLHPHRRNCDVPSCAMQRHHPPPCHTEPQGRWGVIKHGPEEAWPPAARTLTHRTGGRAIT